MRSFFCSISSRRSPIEKATNRTTVTTREMPRRTTSARSRGVMPSHLSRRVSRAAMGSHARGFDGELELALAVGELLEGSAGHLLEAGLRLERGLDRVDLVGRLGGAL